MPGFDVVPRPRVRRSAARAPRVPVPFRATGSRPRAGCGARRLSAFVERPSGRDERAVERDLGQVTGCGDPVPRNPSWQLLTRLGHLQRQIGPPPVTLPQGPDDCNRRSRTSRSTNGARAEISACSAGGAWAVTPKGTYRFWRSVTARHAAGQASRVNGHGVLSRRSGTRGRAIPDGSGTPGAHRGAVESGTSVPQSPAACSRE